MIVPDQKNIKVHFAATENINQFNVIKSFNYKYCLYTAFPFLERQIYKKFNHPIISSQYKKNIYDIPKEIIKYSNHTIQDSGLFTLMFGSRKGKKDKYFLDMYCEKLIEFTLNYGIGSTVVEMDTQKILGVESAWKYRKKMKKSLTNRIINVFHLEDGQRGLDRLIEYSDYIALSVPELRFAKKKKYVYKLANYIKNKKPSIDIHLLGCTEKKIIKELNFCSSCDSSSYTSGIRYGYINNKKISTIKKNEVKKLISLKDYNFICQYISENTAIGLILNVYSEIQKYNKFAGCQL
jgi:hypothetical protein